MALVRVSEIGEMTCDFDITLGTLSAVVISHNRAVKPQLIFYDETDKPEETISVDADALTAVALLSPKTVTTERFVHPSFGPVTRLVLPPFAFYEHV